MWANQGSRNMGGPGPVQRNQGTPIPSQQNQPDDMFSIPSRLNSTSQGSFRFGAQGNVGQSSQPQPGSVDEFPPLGRNANGEIGGERGSSLMSSLGFGSQGTAGASPSQGNRAGNGLLNALSANTRTAESRSPVGAMRPLDGAIGNDVPAGKEKEENENEAPAVQDPLAGMAPIDKWGLKGLRTLMNNYPDYNALICGIDPSTLGVDINSNEPISTQIYSLFDDVPPRPAVPKFRLPDCYNVTNVQPIEHKIPSFNEETLMWIFYSSPNDIKQHLAAGELHNRNWRWHKKLQIWLTKDDMLLPQVLSPNHERGYYIIWDTVNWRKERREFTLHYADLETTPGPTA
ncbi:putative not2 not3 not5 family protein [Phaeoacremonium minimum UCRPA7]|uniref:Putative not2 not3 not5 family protein n=1 Tax=Phaeoacremonium minimum (strain UCR-PA7) TaxID=1286976 RepID=R8BX76_PHAM7|nr:putative not2 not3 not5 family protein [Phaeoacremonium minimum UCRPA7]EOO03884.1 putative not2 not3 not5 family protein [Phaeoacremonium minimum UCRPA7]